MLEQLAADCLRETGSIVEFACPLCIRVLPASCSTAAHAPAEAVGGRVVTLLCRACNSFLGSEYEASAVRMIRAHVEAKTTGRWTETMRVGSGVPGRSKLKIPVTFVERPKGGHEIHFRPPKSGSAAARRWNEEVRIIAEQESGEFELTTSSPTNVARSIVSWGYLAAFGRIGYRFGASPGGRLVADGLLDPSSTALGSRSRLNVGGAELNGDLEPDTPLLWSTVGTMEHVDGWGWRFGNWIAILPLPWDAAGDIYRKLDVIADSDGTAYGSGRPASPEALEAIFDPNYPWEG
jgi:hypothetical protein